MNVYWLSRDGSAAAEGPFTIAQLRRFHDLGDVTAAAQVCLQGTEDWLPLHEELQADMNMTSPATNLVRPKNAIGSVKKVQKSGCVPLFLFGCGVVVCFVFVPLGLILMVTAFLVDFKNHYFTCSCCGNRVAKESKLCPTCRAILE